MGLETGLRRLGDGGCEEAPGTSGGQLCCGSSSTSTRMGSSSAVTLDMLHCSWSVVFPCINQRAVLETSQMPLRVFVSVWVPCEGRILWPIYCWRDRAPYRAGSSGGTSGPCGETLMKTLSDQRIHICCLSLTSASLWRSGRGTSGGEPSWR